MKAGIKTVTAITVSAVFSTVMPLSAMAAKTDAGKNKNQEYYVWCIYEKKLVHKSSFKLEKAEKRAKRHQKEKGHGTKLLTEKPVEE